MRGAPFAYVTFALNLLTASVTAGQEAPPLTGSPPARTGDQVRVTVIPSIRFVGVLERWGEDSLAVRVGDQLRIVPLAQAEAVEVSRSGTYTGGMIRGMKWGGLIGAPVGALLGVAYAGSTSAGESALLGGLIYGGVGLVAGAVIGAVNPEQRWERVYPRNGGSPTSSP